MNSWGLVTVLHLLDIHHPLGILHQDHLRWGEFGGNHFFFPPELKLLTSGRKVNTSFLVAWKDDDFCPFGEFVSLLSSLEFQMEKGIYGTWIARIVHFHESIYSRDLHGWECFGKNPSSMILDDSSMANLGASFCYNFYHSMNDLKPLRQTGNWISFSLKLKGQERWDFSSKVAFPNLEWSLFLVCIR